jgi:hypothetical protein
MCSQWFNSIDATVVCRELGFSDRGMEYVRSASARHMQEYPFSLFRIISFQVLDPYTRDLKEFQSTMAGSLTPSAMGMKKASWTAPLNK